MRVYISIYKIKVNDIFNDHRSKMNRLRSSYKINLIKKINFQLALYLLK